MVAVPPRATAVMYIGAIQWGPTVHRTLASRTINVMGDLLPPEDFSSPVKLDVVFDVGGPLGEPDFEGVRTGSYSRKQQTAQVQIAITSAESEDPGIPALMVDRLLLAIDAVGERLKRAKVDVPVDEIKSTIEARRDEIVRIAPTAAPIEPWGRDRVTGERVYVDSEALVEKHRDELSRRPKHPNA